MKWSILFWLCLFILYSLLHILVPVAYSDRGGWPIVRDVERVSESGQKAIIAWNGTHETFILSTDVISSAESEVIEIMPLPSNPEIYKGEKQSFQKITELVNTYFLATTPSIPLWLRFYEQGARQLGSPGLAEAVPRITITFQQVIGVHFLTVVETDEAGDLMLWLENFLENEGYSNEFPAELENLISNYLEIGMNFFAVDLIETDSTLQSIDPLVYEFRSQKLYYPLRISTLFSGDTEISLFTLTNGELNHTSITLQGFVSKAQFKIKHETLEEIWTNITRLFRCDPHLGYFRYSGSIKQFSGDILANLEQNGSSSTMLLAVTGLGLGLVFLILLLPMNRIGISLGGNISMARRFDIASVFGGLMGILFNWLGCFLPWGLVGYGENGNVLVLLNSEAFSYPSTATLFLTLLFFVTPWFISSLILRNSKAGPSIQIIGGTCIALLVLVTYSYFMYDMNIGLFAIITGCLLFIAAGVLSLLRKNLKLSEGTLQRKETLFLKTYIFRKLIIASITIIGITLLLFSLLYIAYGFVLSNI